MILVPMLSTDSYAAFRAKNIRVCFVIVNHRDVFFFSVIAFIFVYFFDISGVFIIVYRSEYTFYFLNPKAVFPDDVKVYFFFSVYIFFYKIYKCHVQFVWHFNIQLYTFVSVVPLVIIKL